MTIFPFFLFRQYRPGKYLLQYSRTKKTLFKSIKTRSSKSRKSVFFPKLLTHGFAPKMVNFPIFLFLRNVDQENIFYDILGRKNAFLGFKNKKFKQSKNWHISKVVNPRFSSKNGHFSKFIFLVNIGQKNIVHDILAQKNGFGGYKNKKFKRSKNWHFSKGFPWFWSKNGQFFYFLFYGNIDQKNIFCDILGRKNSFLGYKNKKFKKSKNWHISKRVNPRFWSKNGHFSNFFFFLAI